MRSAQKDDALDLAHGQAIGENEIRALLDQLADAIRAKDVNALMANYAPDVETFDLLAPLQHSGSDAIRKRVSEWFSSFEGPIDYEMHNLSVTAGDDVAFCHSLTGSSGTQKDGTEIEMWWRATNGFRKIGGKWIVTHGHSSEPFDAKSGKALLELKP